LHGNATSGHMAAEKTLQRSHQLCYWPFMSRDIHAWCEKCHSCQARRTPVPRPQAPMKSIVADKPFQDYFTKYVNLFALPDQRAMTVAKCLFENYVQEHGVPESLLLEHSGEWDDYLNQVALAYNTSTHSSTGFTPFFLTHGREARLPADVMFRCMSGVPRSTPGTPADYAAMLVKKFQSAFTAAALNTHQARLQQKEAYDRHVNHHPYEKGDLVWLHDPTTTRMKLTPHWKGPFEILDCLGATGDETGMNYRIRYLLEPEAKAQVVHYK
uniref:Gypsy retrotransposon integrase-like protein 1 n=1 Tax=Latimeria chalumnae TaxID=7897 RepID=H3AAX7_LATCH